MYYRDIEWIRIYEDSVKAYMILIAKNNHKTAAIFEREGNTEILTHNLLSAFCAKSVQSKLHDSR